MSKHSCSLSDEEFDRYREYHRFGPPFRDGRKGDGTANRITGASGSNSTFSAVRVVEFAMSAFTARCLKADRPLTAQKQSFLLLWLNDRNWAACRPSASSRKSEIADIGHVVGAVSLPLNRFPDVLSRIAGSRQLGLHDRTAYPPSAGARKVIDGAYLFSSSDKLSSPIR